MEPIKEERSEMAPWMEDEALSTTLQMLQNCLQMSLKAWNSLPETDPSLPMAEIPDPPQTLRNLLAVC